MLRTRESEGQQALYTPVFVILSLVGLMAYRFLWVMKPELATVRLLC